MSFWLEYDEAGAVLGMYSGAGEQHPLKGGILLEVDRLYGAGETMVLDGVVVEFGPPPSEHHVKDAASRSWVLRSGVSALALAQAEKWAEIRAERDRRESGTFPYMGKELQCDVVSVLRMTGAKEAALAAISNGVTFSETWTCADNSLLPVDAEAVLGMLPALAVFSSSLHATARLLRAQIYAEDATEASVEAVTWPG
jgi:hypothetical protein